MLKPAPTEKRPTVWVPQDVGHDVSDASRFGDITFVLDRFDKVTSSPGASKTVKQAVGQMRPGDYLLLIGDPLTMNWLTSLAFARFGRVKALRWSRADRCYQVYEYDEKTVEGQES